MHDYLKGCKARPDKESLIIHMGHATSLWMLTIFILVFFVTSSYLDLEVSDATGYAIEHKGMSLREWISFLIISVIFLVVSMSWSGFNSVKIILSYKERIKFSVIIFLIVFLTLGFMYLQNFESICGDLPISSLYNTDKKELSKIFYACTGKIKLLEADAYIGSYPSCQIWREVLIFSSLAILGILMFFSAIVMSLLVSSVSLLTIDYRASEEMFRRRTREIYMGLYSSAAMLTAAVFLTYCLNHLFSALGARDLVYYVSENRFMATGLFFTLMLSVIYIPLFIKRNFLLNDHLIKKGFASKEDIENWYAVNLLERRAGVDFFGISAILIPVITGVLINVLSKHP
uniref:Uncharacterized protein n=1 Tax=Candidatus Kentrum sp. SD TaxID=2126332 RepID=A0A451BI95_9GAMM|nr:MAG: hypothetical protein BECKSD772D_GA0070982_100425 [Candidatus Kentron sp. SD]